MLPVAESSSPWRLGAGEDCRNRLSEAVSVDPFRRPWLLEVQPAPTAERGVKRLLPHLGNLVGALIGSDPDFSPSGAPSAAEDALPSGPHTVSMRGLGRARLQVSGRHGPIEVPRRLAEVAILVADDPVGLTGAQLAVALHDKELAPSTIRAAVTRLNQLVGFQLVRSQPYKLAVEVTADWQELRTAAARGRCEEVVDRYVGLLMPLSEAPGIEDLRQRIHLEARSALLASDDQQLLMGAMSQPHFEEDIELLTQLTDQFPHTSAIQRLAQARLERFRV
jgi:hypothetical protein